LLHGFSELFCYCRQWTGIKVSVGVAPTKVLAKLANRLSKKNKEQTIVSCCWIRKKRSLKALRTTAIGEIWGIGNQYAQN